MDSFSSRIFVFVFYGFSSNFPHRSVITLSTGGPLRLYVYMYGTVFVRARSHLRFRRENNERLFNITSFFADFCFSIDDDMKYNEGVVFRRLQTAVLLLLLLLTRIARADSFRASLSVIFRRVLIIRPPTGREPESLCRPLGHLARGVPPSEPQNGTPQRVVLFRELGKSFIFSSCRPILWLKKKKNRSKTISICSYRVHTRFLTNLNTIVIKRRD